MCHNCKTVSHLNKGVTLAKVKNLKNGSHSQKRVTLAEKGHACKNGSHLNQRSHLKKIVTCKNGTHLQTSKNLSHLQKMGHTSKNKSHLENWVLGPIRTSRRRVYLDKIFVITNVLQVQCYKCSATSLLRLDKFWPKRTKLQTLRRQNLSQVKTGQNRLNKQNLVYLVINMSKSF